MGTVNTAPNSLCYKRARPFEKKGFKFVQVRFDKPVQCVTVEKCLKTLFWSELSLQWAACHAQKHTTSMIVLFAWIWGDARWRLQVHWTPKDWLEGSIRAKDCLVLNPWASIASDPPSEITLDAGIWGNYAGSEVKLSCTLFATATLCQLM